MKISLAITLYSDKHGPIIEEGDGNKLLAEYKRGKDTRTVATNLPDMEIAVKQRPNKSGFKIFLIDKKRDKAVGLISMMTNYALKKQVYEEKLVYFKPAYRKFGYMSALYRWFLDAGHIYMSDDLHSPGSHAVWNKLANEYKSVLLDTRTWKIVPMSDLRKAYTQLVLFGKDRTISELKVMLAKVNT